MKKILFFGLLLRLICLYLFRSADNFDLQSYLQVGELTLNKINIYPDTGNLHHPYFPFFLYLEALAFYFKKFNLDPIMVIKFFNVIFDLGNLYLIFLLSEKNLNTALLYALNPVTILIATFHGQFDSLPIFFLLLSLYLIKVKKETSSILLLSASVMIKTWPLLFFFSIYKKLKRKKLILLIFVFPILSIIIYSILFQTSVVSIIKTIINYQGLWGIWSIWTFLGRWRLRWQKLSTIIFLICFFIHSFLNRKNNLVKEILYLLFFFFILTPNFSIQYFSWIMPFLVIVKPKKNLLLILSITLTLIFHYATPHLIIFQNATQLITWLLFIYSYKVSGLTEEEGLKPPLFYWKENSGKIPGR